MGVFSRTAMRLILLVGALVALAAAVPEPEPNAAAEPWYGYGYGGYGYGGYYRPHGYGYWGRKRRSAEPNAVAEPSADANTEDFGNSMKVNNVKLAKKYF